MSEASRSRSGEEGWLDPEVCNRARLARDARFDGRFFVGVLTTGIYCRPICPVRPPREENVRFFPTAAAATAAGLRPCLRCRPEAAPGTPAWAGTSATVTRALRLIAEGALDEAGVEVLAARLGIGERHLRRLFLRHLGASPRAVARTRRLHFAKQLVDETELKMADVAFAAGFGSVRRFNAAFRESYGRTPRELRRGQPSRSEVEALSILLPYRPPLDWRGLLGFLARRSIPGVEAVSGQCYRRTILIGGRPGTIQVAPVPGAQNAELRVVLDDPSHLIRVVEKVRGILDLDADPVAIAAHLRRHERLGNLVKGLPGLRVPGSWDGFELGVRAILGQQVTVRGATTLAGRLARAYGEPLPGAEPDADGLSLLFPTPDRLAEADLASLGMPGARARAIRGFASAVARGELRLDGRLGLEEAVAELVALPGIGDWTAQYIAMRALREPDAFPAGDLVVRRQMANGSGTPSVRETLAMAESWRPWRAYATLALWHAAALGESPKERQRG